MTIVVGGHSRNIGKTSVVCGLIRALEGEWTAVKITQFGHNACSASGTGCECTTGPEHPLALSRETDRSSGTDTSRFLTAGARESLWLRTRSGELGFAVPAIRRILSRSANVILESNSVIQFIRPDFYLFLLESSVRDFKVSARMFLDRADAFLSAGEILDCSGVPRSIVSSKPIFQIGEDLSVTAELLALIRERREHEPQDLRT